MRPCMRSRLLGALVMAPLLAAGPLLLADSPCPHAADYNIARCTTCNPDTTPCSTYLTPGTCDGKFFSVAADRQIWGRDPGNTVQLESTTNQAACVKKFQCFWQNGLCRTASTGTPCNANYYIITLECLPPPKEG